MLVLVAPVLLAALLIVFVTWWRRQRLLRGLAVPAGASLVWGHEKAIFEAETGALYTAWANELGPTFKIKSPWLHPESLVTADPGAINYIFSKNTFNYHHSPVFRPLIERIIGRGLSWVEEQSEHRRMRAIVSPALTLSSVRNMNGTMWDIAHAFQAKLAAHIQQHPEADADKRAPTAVIDLTYWMTVVTLEVIGRVGFKHDFGLGESDDAKLIINGWHEQASAGLLPSGFVGLVILRTFPFITSLPVEAMQKQGETKQIVQRLARRLVATTSLEGNTDILSLLVTAQHREEKHKQATLDEIIEHITTFAISGQATSAGTLLFGLHSLAKYPVYQERLRDELLAFGREPTFDELWNGEALPYLDAVIKETLRLFPSASHTEKVVQEDDVIPLRYPVKSADGKHFIHEVPVRKGQVIHIPSRAVDRLQRVWGDDAELFNPERFLHPERLPKPEDTTSGWARLFCFSEGPRSCVGLRLALFELKVIMFTLVLNFKLEDTGAVVVPRFASILQPLVEGEEAKGVQLPIRISNYAS